MPEYLKLLTGLTRRNKIVLQLLVDAFLVCSSFVGAMAFRLESFRFIDDTKLWYSVLLSVAATLAAFYFFGLYRSMVRYVTNKVLITVGVGAIASAIALYVGRFALDAFLPRSVPIIHAVFVFLSVGGLRFMARHMFRVPDKVRRMPVLIYGAGEAGLQLLHSLIHGLEYFPVALVDDNPKFQKMIVGGRRVFPSSSIPRLVNERDVQTILLAMPSVGRRRRREIIESLQDLQVEIKTIPGMSDIISGKAEISELRSVTPEELLGRDLVEPDPQLIRRNIVGKSVMVSGAGGSIGSELCRQILMQDPTTLVLYESSELALYTIESELSETVERQQLSTSIIPVLGSVQNSARLEITIRRFGVQTIYHAAAYKHVPLVEENVVEGIQNNVFGTLTISSVAKSLGVESFTLISTDKAVRPANIMGATKRLAELICQAAASDSSTTVFAMVRFGNVLGSSGSVIPRFRTQIENGGPITVTHADINRYFMTIPEAAQLVIQAGAMAKGGDVFVLDMGEPVRIMDLATTMVRLHGLTPYVVDNPDQVFPEKGDIPICVTGLRKGEKLYEELLIGNSHSTTSHPRILSATEISLSPGQLHTMLERLKIACELHDLPAIYSLLHELPLDYSPVDSA